MFAWTEKLEFCTHKIIGKLILQYNETTIVINVFHFKLPKQGKIITFYRAKVNRTNIIDYPINLVSSLPEWGK